MTVLKSNEFELDIEEGGKAYVEVGGMEFEIPVDKLFEEVRKMMVLDSKYQSILTKANFLSFMKASGLEEWSGYENLKVNFEEIYAKLD